MQVFYILKMGVYRQDLRNTTATRFFSKSFSSYPGCEVFGVLRHLKQLSDLGSLKHRTRSLGVCHDIVYLGKSYGIGGVTDFRI